ncbi:hypothetical protein IJ182_03620 [bacterium]|nr:hypothetical protein [bacterium]
MNNIISPSVYNQKQIPVSKIDSQQGNFGAIDTEKLKQDTVEVAQKTEEQVKENWFFRTLRNTFGVKDPKKFTISAALTIATVVGLAAIGNKMADPTAEFGVGVDEKLKANKLFSGISNIAKKVTGGIKSFVLKHSKTARDLEDTFKNRMAKPKTDLTRGYGRGFVSIFSLTPVDIIKKAFAPQAKDYARLTDEMVNISNTLNGTGEKTKKGLFHLASKAAKGVSELSWSDYATAQEKQKEIYNKVLGSVKKLVGDTDGGKNARLFTDHILGLGSDKIDNREFCSLLSNAIRENFGCTDNNRKFLNILKGLKAGNIEGLDVSEFTNVNMKGGGIVGSWWPVNIINKIISTVTGKPSTFGRGRLGDSLIKFNAVNGTLADTQLGKLVQKSVIVPTESISNFVNDKSGLGVGLCTTVMSTYNAAQDAPKGEKGATVADNFVGTIGSIAIATPLAFKTTYGLASLANLKGDGIISGLLKKVGSIFAMGLDKVAADGSKIVNKSHFKGFAGGAMRFILIMFVFSSLFAKPINKLIHKVFGTPSTKKAENKDNQNNQNNSNNQINDAQLNAAMKQESPQTVSTVINDVKPQDTSTLGDTNLIKRWTQLPDSNQPQERYIPSIPVNVINNQFNLPNNSPIASQPVIEDDKQLKENDQIAAFNLFKKKDKGERYIPKLEQAQTNEQEQEAALQNQVNEILKQTDSVISKTKKYL